MSILQCREGHALKYSYEYESGHEPNGSKDSGTESKNKLVLYQKGILPAKRPRCCDEDMEEDLISCWKLQSGNKVADIPIDALWLCPNEYPWIPACEACGSTGCDACMGDSLSPSKAFLVNSRTQRNLSVCRVYVCFEDRMQVLTPVPERFLKPLIKRAGAGRCRCGACRHPLKRFYVVTADRGSASFDKRNVAMFKEQRNVIIRNIELEAASRNTEEQPSPPEKRSKMDTLFQASGTCAICLEDGLVASPCVHKACKASVCQDCHVKMRGLCAICDRAKISGSVRFYCERCCSEVPLGHFGYECIGCNKPHICKDCHEEYGMCGECKVGLLFPAKKKADRP